MKNIPLSTLATVIRSKNAGPYLLTFDVMFDSSKKFQLVWDSGAFTKENLALLFGVPPSLITSVFAVPEGKAIKMTMRRPLAQGTIGEGDMYGCQQHAPLLDLKINIKSA